MKNMRKFVAMLLTVVLLLTCMSAFAGDEPDEQPFDVGQYLADVGLNFSYVGEVEHPITGVLCKCWQREYGGKLGRIWIPVENCTLKVINECFTRYRKFFFPWEEEENKFYSLEELEEDYKISIQIEYGENGGYVISYNGMTTGYMEDGNAISMVPQGGIMEVDGNLMIQDKMVTYIVTGGKY